MVDAFPLSADSPAETPRPSGGGRISNDDIYEAILSLASLVQAAQKKKRLALADQFHLATPSVLEVKGQRFTADDVQKLQEEAATANSYLDIIKQELAALHLGPKTGLNALKDELADAKNEIRQSTARILGAMEQAQKLCDLLHAAAPDQKDAVSALANLVIRTMESCGIEDIVGQRLDKVYRALSIVDAHVSEMVALWGSPYIAQYAATDEDGEASLLNGPAHRGKAVSQEEIDALFS